MRIAQLAPPFVPVPPTTYGGTERVVSILTEQLVERGHDVTLFASGDSVTSARLVPIVERALWYHETDNNDFTPFWAIALGKLASRLNEFDLVHNHLDFLAYPLSRVAGCPLVTTLHGRLDLPALTELYQEFADVPLVSVSNAQREPHPDANWVATVYHAVELDQLPLGPGDGGYLAYLGRISPEKGLDVAIRVARRSGLLLKVAARLPLPHENDPNAQADRVYFDNVVQPLLDCPGVELLGESDTRRRAAFLGRAAALVFPISWPEPFGLVMPEAMACGTPVLALRAGSVPEIVEDGLTGFICDDEDGLVDAVRHLPEIDRRRCRAEAERRFSPATMAAAYEQVYTRLLARTPDARVSGQHSGGIRALDRTTTPEWSGSPARR